MIMKNDKTLLKKKKQFNIRDIISYTDFNIIISYTKFNIGKNIHYYYLILYSLDSFNSKMKFKIF
jgi:hypothetical protein